MAVGLQIKVGADVTGLMGAFQAAAGGAGSLTDTLKTTIATMSPVGAAGVAVADALIGMTEAAAADRDEQNKLNAVYATATGSTQDYTTAIDAAIKSGADKAFSDSEVRAGLESLITATGDADTANAELAKAMDIARLAGVPLEQAADALAKAHQGQTGALAKPIPGLEKSGSAADVMAEATRLAAGQADEYAKSSEGMKKKGGDAFAELSETIGSVFLPIMDEILPLLSPFVELLGELLKVILPPLKIAISLVVNVLRIMLGVVKTIVEWISKLVDWLSKAMDAIGKFLDSINPLKGISLPSLPFMASAGAFAAEGRSVRSGRSGGGGGGGPSVVVNVQSADPTEVVRAIRRWSRNNGGSGPFTRGLDRSTG